MPVFTADVRFEGFTTDDWVRVLSLFRPRTTSGADRDPDRPQGAVFAVVEKGRLRKLVHTRVGRLRLEDAQRDWPMSAEQLVVRHAASWGAILETGALEEIMERFGARARRGDDLTTQLLSLLLIARDEVTSGRIDLWPRRLRGVPIPSPNMVSGTLDTICPVGHAMVLGMFEAGELWTSLALSRRADGVDCVLGPDELRAEMGLLSGDWRRDYRHLARAVEGRLGPIALGCYAEASTFRKLEVDPAPGAWARAVTVRDVVLHPIPPAMAIPLGLDAGRAAFAAMRAVVEHVDPLGILAPTLERIKQATPLGGADAMRFQPLEIVRRILSRDA